MQQQIQKVGQVTKQGQKKETPMQVVNITYGHNGSGKLYSYLGQNKRVGDIVTPIVTNKKTGKRYKTLGVVRSTHTVSNALNTVAQVPNMKTLGTTEQKSLPNYYKGWEKDAQAAYDLKKEVQLNSTLNSQEKASLFQEIRQMREEDKVMQRLLARGMQQDASKAAKRLLRR